MVGNYESFDLGSVASGFPSEVATLSPSFSCSPHSSGPKSVCWEETLQPGARVSKTQSSGNPQ